MTPAQLDTARALVASPHWRWMPGMIVSWEHKPMQVGVWDWSPRVARLVDSDSGWLPIATVRAVDQIPPDALPDLTDPATVGCLAHLARELWSPEIVYIRSNPSGRWYVVAPPNGGMGGGLAWRQGYDTTGEAWAALILAAPEPAP